MKFQQLIILIFITFSFLLSACNDKKAEPVFKQNTSSAVMTNNAETDKWLGKWNGPEGTFLKLTGGNGKYEITIQNLDGPKIFNGIGLSNEIQFERNGVIEKIHATNGAQTGMKWLGEKQNCLTINPGEGFCRD